MQWNTAWILPKQRIQPLLERFWVSQKQRRKKVKTPVYVDGLSEGKSNTERFQEAFSIAGWQAVDQSKTEMLNSLQEAYIKPKHSGGQTSVTSVCSRKRKTGATEINTEPFCDINTPQQSMCAGTLPHRPGSMNDLAHQRVRIHNKLPSLKSFRTPVPRIITAILACQTAEGAR